MHADLLEKRSHASGVAFQHVMQADFVLFLRGCFDILRGVGERWWPDTLLFSDEFRSPFEIFARAQSAQYFSRVGILFDIKTKAEIDPIFQGFKEQKIYSPTWEMRGINSVRLMAFEKLASTP
jgi:hypothetical protein